MKSFLARACGKIGRFFWSWGFLKFVLWAITLIILFYAEEDWRGARTWAATKAKWEAQGETFDIMRLAPRPVPDDENLAALPLFNMDPDPDPDPQRHGYLTPVTLRKAFAWNWDASSDMPRGGRWEWGHLANAEKNRALVASAYAATFKDAHSTADAFTQFSALMPAIGHLRSDATARPYCRFEQTYWLDSPNDSYLSREGGIRPDLDLQLLTEQIALSRFLSADAILALTVKKSDVAQNDILIHYNLMSGCTQQPMLFAGLVAIGMQAINLPSFYQGLATHAWTDEQLAELQTRLASVDFLSSFHNAFRGEACIAVEAYERLKPLREQLVAELRPKTEMISLAPSDLRRLNPLIWPNGWFDLMESRSANLSLSASRLVDLQNRILSPQEVAQFVTEIENHEPLLFGQDPAPIKNAAQKFAIAQVRLDETRLAIALERYHLAHGVYPAMLDELAPTYIASVPHDIIDGKPYHYQLRPDGTFLLYSVGWNQVDDGGAFVFKKDNPKGIDYENGDWPWPTPK